MGGVAERQGFEPWIEFPLYTLSKRAPSATRPSLRLGTCEGCIDSSIQQPATSSQSATAKRFCNERSDPGVASEECLLHSCGQAA